MRQVQYLVWSLLFSEAGTEGIDIFMRIIAISEENATTPLTSVYDRHKDSRLGLLSCLLVFIIGILQPTRAAFSLRHNV